MKTFVIVFLVVNILTLVFRTILACVNKYPRKTERTAAQDMVFNALDAGIIAWCVYLLR